jgi:hypothetical protein
MGKQYKEFLDKLRDSGKVNMFGAGPYIQKEFRVDKREAGKILMNWIESYSDET